MSVENQQWINGGDKFKLGVPQNFIENIEKAVYRIEPTMMGPVVIKISERFEFPYKIYGMETNFINRVVRTWDKTTGNMGILLNGVKGTGKTVTAKQICNMMDLPVIIVNGPDDQIMDFLRDVHQDIIVFYDEYEKIFENGKYNQQTGQRDNTKDADLLSIMDGASAGTARKMFILTTNNKYINENLIDRPSRVRYVKEFTDLTKEVITEIVDDIIENKELTNVTVNYISELKMISVDIVKAVVEEVNIHNEDPANFKDIFNAAKLGVTCNLYSIDKDDNQKLVTFQCNPSHKTVVKENIGGIFHDGMEELGTITDVDKTGQIVTVQPRAKSTKKRGTNEVVVSNPPLVKYYIETSNRKHKSYSADAYSQAYGYID